MSSEYCRSGMQASSVVVRAVTSLSSRSTTRYAAPPQRVPFRSYVAFYVTFRQNPSILRAKPAFGTILVGELSHSFHEWQSEAGGGTTSCLSAFLEVAGLGRNLNATPP